MSRAKPRKRMARAMYSVCRGCIRRMGAEGRCLTYNRDFHEAIGETDHRLIRVEIVREVLSPKRGER